MQGYRLPKGPEITAQVTSWNWGGPGYNALVEVSYERNVAVGLSPRILWTEDVGYNATFTGRTNEEVLGCGINAVRPSDVETASLTSLPAIGFLVASMSTAVIEHDMDGTLRIQRDASGTLLQVRSSTATRNLRILDAAGRTVLEQSLTGGQGTVDIGELARGAYVLSAITAEGGVSSVRFVRE